MTRILLTCEDYLPQVGGAEICVANLKSEYERLGHAVTVFTNTLDTTPGEGTSVARVPWKFSPVGLWRNASSLWKLIGSHDVVHSQYSFRIACLCAVIARLRGKPMILSQQGKGIVPEVNPRFFDALLVKVCQHVSMRGASLITSTSDEITDLTAAFVSRSKIVSVPNGYDARSFQPDASLPVPPEYAGAGDAKRLLTVRRLVPKNGIHILVQALALVKERRSDFMYFSIGEGRHRERIEGWIRELGLSNNVVLLGKRPNDTIKAYIQHADLVLVPSSAESTSIACIEAMGMGKPIVASRVGGLIDLLGKQSEYGELVAIYDSEACTYDPPETMPRERLQPLADAILSFLEAPQPFIERGEKARQLANERYSWEVIARTYLSLYARFLDLPR